jgi:hypothetical protein
VSKLLNSLRAEQRTCNLDMRPDSGERVSREVLDVM